MLKYIVVVTDWDKSETLYDHAEEVLTTMEDITSQTTFDTEKEASKHLDKARRLGLSISKSKKVLSEVRSVEIEEKQTDNIESTQ